MSFSQSRLHLLFFLILLPCSRSESNHTALVYHHCTTTNSNQTSISQILPSLFESLVKHSTNSTFHKQITTTANGTPISGEYQCRGDMSFPACQSCVTHSSILSNRLCAGAKAARVQLSGCYVRYEAGGDEEEEERELAVVVLHKKCGDESSSYDDDDGARDAALRAVEEGVVKSGGFCEARNEGVRAVAQCDGGGLLGCDCAECVSRAVEVVRQECRGRLDGDVYLDGCYVTYTTHTYSLGYKKNNGSSGKLVAIVLGGAATLGLGLILLMFFKACGKKDND